MTARTAERLRIEAGLENLLARGVARAAAERRGLLVSLTVPAGGPHPLPLFRRASALGVDCAFWEQPSAGVALAGLGAAHAISPRGGDRFRQASRAWRELLCGALIEGVSDLPGTGPLLLGGFAFDPERRGDGRWAGFPDARLVLPRLLLAEVNARCWVTVNAVVWPDSDPRELGEAVRRELDVLVHVGAGTEGHEAHSYAAGDLPPAGGLPPSRLPLHEVPPPHAWRATVADAARAARGGALDKVVLAREVRASGRRAFDAGAALAALRATYPTCYIFAFSRGARVFLGATPERLARVAGDRVEAACLAGSIRRGATPEEDRRLGQALLASEKDRIEHEIVVRALRSGLAEVCAGVEAPERPVLMSVSNIHHLYTPVQARLGPGRTLLDLVERLHPTPAVGGWPREGALGFIREREGLDRGWYAAPVGWIDGRGDGEFAVALRSALVDGRKASLFAGCGIVGDSDPAREYAESWLKLRPMLGALGIQAEG